MKPLNKHKPAASTISARLPLPGALQQFTPPPAAPTVPAKRLKNENMRALNVLVDKNTLLSCRHRMMANDLTWETVIGGLLERWIAETKLPAIR